MSIHFISGKPGGGKTLYTVKLIIEELVYGTRQVVTNVSLNLGRLNEYLQQTYPKESIDLHARVKKLTDDQCREFWKYRDIQTPVLFALDELHLFFNAREWMNTGPACLHYLSQHRKLGDDIICVTQHVENVDKQFRSVAQDFTLIVNGFKQKFGLFRGLPMFTRYTFAQPPSGLKMQPDETAHFRLDAKGIASCYDTAAGIGVHGRGADKKEKAKGLHPVMFPLIAAGVIVLIVLGVKGCNKAMSAGMKAAKEKKQDAVAHPPPVSQSETKQGGGVAQAMSRALDLPSRPQQPPQRSSEGGVADRPEVVQKLIRGGRVRIVLSDGRVFESSDEELEEVRPHKVKISGEWHYYRKPGPGIAPQRAVEDRRAEPEAVVQKPEPPKGESSWVEYADGTSRLKDPPKTIADSFR